MKGVARSVHLRVKWAVIRLYSAAWPELQASGSVVQSLHGKQIVGYARLHSGLCVKPTLQAPLAGGKGKEARAALPQSEKSARKRQPAAVFLQHPPRTKARSRGPLSFTTRSTTAQNG